MKTCLQPRASYSLQKNAHWASLSIEHLKCAASQHPLFLKFKESTSKTTWQPCNNSFALFFATFNYYCQFIIKKGEMEWINNSTNSPEPLSTYFPILPFLTTIAGHISAHNNYIISYISFPYLCPSEGKPTRQTGRWHPLERLIPNVLVIRLRRIRAHILSLVSFLWLWSTCSPQTSNNFFWGQQ